MYSLDTWQVCYRHIVDVHEEFICRTFLYPPRNAVLSGYTVFSLSMILSFCDSVIVNILSFAIYHSTDSAYFVKSISPRAFSVSFQYFVGMLQTY